MTRRQRTVVWIWIAAVVGAGLFPPWADRGFPERYYCLFLPPHSRMHIDQARLTLEWLLLSVVGAGCFFAWPKRTHQGNPEPVTPKMPPEIREWMEWSGEKFVFDPNRQKWVMERCPDAAWDIATGKTVRFEHTRFDGHVRSFTMPLNVFQRSVGQYQCFSGSVGAVPRRGSHAG